MATKVCSKCKIEKDVGEFNKSRSECKGCQKEYYENNKDERKQYGKEYRENHKDKKKNMVKNIMKIIKMI